MDKSTRMKGKVIKKSFSPSFNEKVRPPGHTHFLPPPHLHFQFTYVISEEELPKRTLQLVVFATSGTLVTTKTCLATLSIDLQSIQGDLTAISGVSGWYDLLKPPWTK